MKWIISFSFSITFLLSGLILYSIRKCEKNSAVKYLGVGVFLASVSICFPVMQKSEGVLLAFAMSVSHSIRMFVVDTGMLDILDELPAGQLGALLYPYKIIVCFLYLLAPIFTLSIVVQYFSNIFERMRLGVGFSRTLFVFSELNEHALEIASYMKRQAKDKKKKIIIVFCEANKHDGIKMDLEEQARALKCVLLPEEIVQLRLNSKRRYVTYFLNSDNQGENVERTLQILNLMTNSSSLSHNVNQNHMEIRCYATNAEAEILIDATEKNDIRVILVDEVRTSIYEHLYQYPLYTYRNKKGRISLLILGAGKTGIEFLKAAVWFGQMLHSDLEIHVIDQNGNAIYERLALECPELLADASGYKIYIHEEDVLGSQVEMLLREIGEIQYCVCALSDDEITIRAAIWMRRYFYRKQESDMPFICAHVRSARKYSVLFELNEVTRDKTKQYYDIIPFGKEGQYYSSGSDASFLLEYLGLGVQSHYFRLHEQSSKEERACAVRNYYQKQFNRRSSIANGLHITCKLWEMGYGILRIPTNLEDIELFRECISQVDFWKETRNIRKPYYSLEHDRWMAYIRTEGWRLSTKGTTSISDMRACYEEYCEHFKNQNYVMKMHPALVPIVSDDDQVATLQEVDDMLVSVNKERGLDEYYPDYVQSDVELVDHIGEIVLGKWCGKDGIHIHGILAKEGMYAICRLDDLLQYSQKQYERNQDRMSHEESRLLSEQIRKCKNYVKNVCSD